MANYDADYDLAILGGSVGSRLAACMAVQQGARVALIAPNWWANDAWYYLLRSLREAGGSSDIAMGWSVLLDWVHYQGEQSVLSPAALNSQGIDVILEAVSFTRDRRLKLNQRHLKASRYLLTDGYDLSSTMAGLPCHQLAQLELLPDHIAVMGYGAMVVEWAYALSLRARVTLIVLDQRLLPAEDEDIQRLVKAQLKSLGIKVVCLPPGASRDQLEAVTAGALLVNVPQPYSWKSLALDNIGMNARGAIEANPYLQTRCPHVYVSGGSQGGENRPELTRQETAVAMANALFGRRHMMLYGQAFYSIYLLSTIGHWGLTECQARQRYGHGIQIFQASCLPQMANHVAQTNFCKIITQDQQIMGMHLMGDGASELIATLGNRPDMKTLNQLLGVSLEPGTLQEAIYQAIAQWQHGRWRAGTWRRDWAENWFNFRRSSSL